MLSALVLNGVSGEVDCTDVVIINNGGTAKGTTKLTQKLAEPTGFSNAIGHGVILGLSTRTGHYQLALGRPGDEIVPKEDSIIGGRLPSIKASGPISIGVNYKINRRSPVEVKAEILTAL